MSWMPEQEPTPLRLRLGPRSEVPLRPAFEDALSDIPLDPANDDGRPLPLAPEAHASVESPTVESKDPLRAAAWRDGAERLTKRRFADCGLSSEASDSPKA